MEREYLDEIVEPFLLYFVVLIHDIYSFWMFLSRFTFFPSFGWKTGYSLSISPLRKKQHESKLLSVRLFALNIK